MRLGWTSDAASDLEQIGGSIEQDSPAVALRVTRKIYRAAPGLQVAKSRPKRLGAAGTRELMLTPLPYVVAYKVAAGVVEIHHIYHGSRNWQQ